MDLKQILPFPLQVLCEVKLFVGYFSAANTVAFSKGFSKSGRMNHLPVFF